MASNLYISFCMDIPSIKFIIILTVSVFFTKVISTFLRYQSWQQKYFQFIFIVLQNFVLNTKRSQFYYAQFNRTED